MNRNRCRRDHNNRGHNNRHRPVLFLNYRITGTVFGNTDITRINPSLGRSGQTDRNILKIDKKKNVILVTLWMFDIFNNNLL